jgi:hypothetical protein
VELKTAFEIDKVRLLVIVRILADSSSNMQFGEKEAPMQRCGVMRRRKGS